MTAPKTAPQPVRRGRPAGVVRGGVLVAGLALLAGCASPENEEVVGDSTPTPAVSASPTSIFQLSPGQCFDRPAEDGLYEVAVVPCHVAHDLEMYALFQLEDPAWPGDDAVHRAADAGCRAEFVNLTGEDPAESSLGYTMYTPSEGSWSEGDRQVQCAVQLNSGGRMIGSQLGG